MRPRPAVRSGRHSGRQRDWLAGRHLHARGHRRPGRVLPPVTATTWGQRFKVGAMAAALMIGEFTRRHVARGADLGRIIGLTSGGDLGLPEEVPMPGSTTVPAHWVRGGIALRQKAVVPATSQEQTGPACQTWMRLAQRTSRWATGRSASPKWTRFLSLERAARMTSTRRTAGRDFAVDGVTDVCIWRKWHGCSPVHGPPVPGYPGAFVLFVRR